MNFTYRPSMRIFASDSLLFSLRKKFSNPIRYLRKKVETDTLLLLFLYTTILFFCTLLTKSYSIFITTTYTTYISSKYIIIGEKHEHFFLCTRLIFFKLKFHRNWNYSFNCCFCFKVLGMSLRILKYPKRRGEEFCRQWRRG